MIKSVSRVKHSREMFERTTKQLDHILDDHFSCGFTVQELKKDIRGKLLRPIRFLRTKDFEFLDTEDGDLANADCVNDLERNYVFLWAAFAVNDLALLQELQRQGADVKFAYPGENVNALHLCALGGSTECVRWLLQQGCEIIETRDHRLSPLHFAVFKNALPICRLLVESGCPLDSKALHMAVRASALDCVEYLIDQQVSVNEYDESGTNALHVAADIGNVDVLRMLLSSKRVDLDKKTMSTGYTALHLAAENGHHAALTLLLDSGARIDEVTFRRQTALQLASKQVYVDCVETLLKRGAAINCADDEGRTPLHAAVSSSHNPMQILVVRALTDQEADVHLADAFGHTALHTAALNELDECVQHLIMCGANATAKTNGNITALNIMKRKTPMCLEKIVDRLDLCMAYNTEQLLKFSFRDINRNSVVGEISYLYLLQKEGGQKVLEHPVSQAFLHLKWLKVRRFFLLRIGISLLAVVLFSSLVSWGIKEPKCYRKLLQPILGVCGNAQDEPEKNVSSSIDGCTRYKVDLDANLTNLPSYFSMISCPRDTCKMNNSILMNTSPDTNLSTMHVTLYCDSGEQDTSNRQVCHTNEDILNTIFETYTIVPSIVFVFIVAMLITNIVRIVFTLGAYKSVRHFFMQYSNIMEIVVTVCVTFTLINLCTKNMEEEIFEKSFASLTLLFSWAYMMVTVSQLPAVGTYVAMFKAVLKEFIKMKIAFLCLMMGFTFAFYTLKKDDFPNPIIAFMKTIAMMTGELDSGDLLSSSTVKFHLYTTAVVLMFFVISITIVLMNLLVGIAVNDVEGLRKNANLSRLIQQTKLIYFLEKACFRGILPAFAKNFLRQFLYMWPDSYTGIVLYVQPLSPNEKRLPRDIMEEGIVRLNKKKLKEKSKKTKAEQRMKKVEEQIQMVYELVRNLPANVVNEIRADVFSHQMQK